jgi:hypothetical protein
MNEAGDPSNISNPPETLEPQENTNPFLDPPKWLEKFTQDNPALVGSVADLVNKRIAENKQNAPWTIYLESIALGRGFAIEKIISSICRFHNYQITPLNIGIVETKDYSDSFPMELTEHYWALPIGLNDTFLNLALLEPEVGKELSDAYYNWLDARRPKALQFFITTPSAYTKFKDMLDRIVARREL